MGPPRITSGGARYHHVGGTARTQPVVARHQGLFPGRDHRFRFMPSFTCLLHITELVSVSTSM
nr:hypothetical protein [Candidatus Sigynarchaeota archaeon]